MTIDVHDYNRRWLQAWTAKDVPALLGFYAEDVVYRDPQTTAGIAGHDALSAYLTGLFAATPPMRYDPDEVWPTADGFCGRWYCTIGPPGRSPILDARIRPCGDGRRQDRPQRGLCASARRTTPALNAPPIVPPAQISPKWMTAALAQAGIAATVAAVHGKRVGTGQVGESVRFTLTYDGDPPADAPRTVVGKFPSSDPESRATGVNFGNYFREVWFYQNLAATAGATTPGCLHADVDPDTHDFVLIMEDLAPAVPGDQMRGVTVAAAALVLEEAAKLHASHWGDDALDDLPWLQDSKAARSLSTPGLMTTLWGAFRERYGERIKPDCLAIGEAITADYATFKDGYAGPRCLTHNDFRPDNMMFGTSDGGYPVAVVDWQSYGYGCCMADVSYFMAGALGPRRPPRPREAAPADLSRPPDRTRRA